ncbi:hypothetical protein WICPIJ_002440 [Wickerhamomyces pijperi]|uniref:Uncharacterized protein n=1 Tax=Wickerhamomyces pijperi TaxID=599730 RepID=A0A9P8TPN8_WICPI|nr:hypothetical protein WICPIJ_002440 [Wickerhamomyces pijperi]
MSTSIIYIHTQPAYILSTGVKPNKTIPLYKTCLAAAGDLVGQLEQVGHHGGRFVGLQGVSQDVWVLGQQTDQDLGLVLLQQRPVGVDQVFGLETGLSFNRFQSGVGVLQVWTSVTFERQHSLPLELVVVDTLGLHILDHDGGDTNVVGNLFWVLDLSVLVLVLLHDLVHLVSGFFQDLVQENNGTLTSRHTLHHTEVDVQQLGGPVVAHLLQDFKELGGVQVLLGGNDVDHLVEGVGLVTLDSFTDVSGQVDLGTVGLLDNTLPQLLVESGQVDQQGTSVFVGQPGLSELVNDVVH